MKRKTSIAAVAVGAALVLAAGAFAAGTQGEDHHHKGTTQGHSTGHAHGGATKDVQYTGEVLDLTCYVVHPATGTGPKHAKCATDCLGKGLPAGLLVENTLYVVFMRDHSSPSKALAPFAGQKITVRGTTRKVGTTHFLEIGKIETPAPKVS